MPQQALKKNETKQAQKKKKKRKEKKEGVMGMKTNEELGLSYIPVLGGYLNLLNNLWFWFSEKLETKRISNPVFRGKKSPKQRTSSSGFMNQPQRMGSLHTKYGAKNR